MRRVSALRVPLRSRAARLPFVRWLQPSAEHRAELAAARTTPYGISLGLLIYFVIGLLFLGPSLVDPRGTFPGFGGDAQQYMWYLGLFWHAVLTGHNPFITHLMNYPRGMNLMWNTSIFAEAVLFGPLVALAGSTLAYNVWFLTNVLLAGVLAQQVFIRLRVRQSLSIAGGALTAMLPYISTQALSHISLVTTAPLLGMLLIAMVISDGRARRPALLGGLFGLLAAMQFYTLIEVLVSASLVAVLVTAVAYFVARPALRTRFRAIPLVFLAAAAFAFALLAAPGVYEMLLGQYRVLSSVQPPNVYVVDLLNLVLPTHAFLVQIPFVDPAHWFTGNFAEDNGYIGIPAMLLLIWVLRRLWSRALVRILAWVAGIVTLLSLGAFLHIAGFVTPLPLPWWIFDHLPLIKDLLPARLMLYADLAFVALMLLGIEHWLQGGTQFSKSPARLLAYVLLTWLPTVPYPNTALPQVTPSFQPGTAVYQALKGQPTYLITIAFPEVMQALQASGYAFPVANFYGHSDNTVERVQRLQGGQVLLNANLSPQVYQTIVVYDLMRLHVTRVVFVPRFRYGATTLPQEALMTLNGALGPPIASSPSGVIVWRVPEKPVFSR